MKPLAAVLAVVGLMLIWLPTGAKADPLDRSDADRPDDLKGPQVHVVYAIPAGAEDRHLDTDGTLVQSVAGFQRWLYNRTGGRSLRMDTAGGALDITFVQLEKTDEQMRDHDPRIVQEIERLLQAEGLIKPGKIYAVYYDGSSAEYCGGAAWPPELRGQVAAMYLRGAVCVQNPGAQYWGYAMLHDTLHAAGFVGRCAPHHATMHRGHVSGPSSDLMYGPARDGDPLWSPTQLDFGRDDYYGHGVRSCPDLADSPYLTARLPPSRNLMRNPSFELDTLEWEPPGTIARVPTAGAPHGDFAVQVSASPGAAVAFLSDCADGIFCTVQNTTPGTRYVASAHVRGADGVLVGRPVTIVLREYTLDGRLVKETVGETVTPTSTFARLTVSAVVEFRRLIDVRLQQKLPVANEPFLADLITMEVRP